MVPQAPSDADALAPLESDQLIETLYRSAQAGHADEKGNPNPLQFAVLQDTYPDLAYLTNLPIPVQKALFTLLAPLGRLLGYEAAPSPPKKATSEDLS